MGKIHQLSPHIINKIAAGEVIERPASVVKELVENAIDAGAGQIDVHVEEGGAGLIRVRDDGHGIDLDDLPLAFSTHATSKLRDPDDLFHIATMGFRGEALSSIGSVSQTTIRTRVAGEESGWELVHQTGEDADVRAAAVVAGTTIEVRNLFQNVPVRRRFLKSTSVELGHVTETMTRFALAHPRIGFSLTHGKREVLRLDPASGLEERISSLYGKDLAGELLHIEHAGEDFRIDGWIAPPHHDRPRQDRIFVFLNSRYIKDRTLTHGILEGYRGYLMTRRHPTVFMNIEMDPGEVDVNVHPTKIEVRFRNSRPIHQALMRSVREALRGADMTPTVRADGASGGAATGHAATGHAATGQAATGQAGHGRNPADEIKEAMRDYLGSRDYPGAPPRQAGRPAAAGSGAAVGETPTLRARAEVLQDPESGDPTPAPPIAGPATTGTTGGGSSVEERGAAPRFAERPGPEDLSAASHAAGSHAGPIDTDASAAAAPHADTAAPFEDADLHQRPPLQLHQTYILRETDDGFSLTDQHALHERILYHQIHDRVKTGKMPVQRMLIPEVIDLSVAEVEELLTHADALRTIGFEIERFGDRSVAIQAVPDLLRRLRPRDLIQQILMWLDRDEAQGGEKDFTDAVIEMAACKAAIKAGDPLEQQQMTDLLRQGHELPTSYSCPHGRPTTLRFTLADLEKWFRRRV